MPRKNRNKKLFFGREKELEVLSRFFEDESGGATLVAGDRGSGKTTLVFEAIERRTQKVENWRRFAYKRTIVLHIPLIMAGSGIDDKSQYYRSLIMRSVVRALEGDKLKRVHPKLDLPLRWFRGIGYLKSVKGLSPYVKYINLQQSTARSIGVGLRDQLGTAGLQRAVSGEIDLGDVSLEIKLRNLLTEYASTQTFIIVLDELDKLPFDNTPISLENMAIFLKNIFTETKTHVVFISDEEPLGRINRTIATNPFSVEKTLFRSRMLLNEFSPQDFSKFFDGKFAPSIPENEREETKYALAIHTNKSPSELNKFILEYGTENVAQSLKDLMGEYEYYYHSAMQVFIDEVYTKMTGRYDAYFSRVLFKALTIAGNILLEASVDYISWKDLSTIFWTTDKFTSTEEEANLKRASYANLVVLNPNIQNAQIPEMAITISEISRDQQRQLNRALEYLLFLLDRAGYVRLERARDRVELIRLTHFLGDTFTVNNIKQPLSDLLKPTTKQQALLRSTTTYKDAYKAIMGSDLWIAVNPNVINGLGGDLTISDFPIAILSCWWEEYEAVVTGAPKAIAQQVLNDLSPVVDVSWTQEIKDNGVIVLSKSLTRTARFQIVFNMGKPIKADVDFGDKDKTFIFNDRLATKLTTGNNPKIKNFNMTEGWTNWPEAFGEMKSWLTDNKDQYLNK